MCKNYESKKEKKMKHEKRRKKSRLGQESTHEELSQGEGEVCVI